MRWIQWDSLTKMIFQSRIIFPSPLYTSFGTYLTRTCSGCSSLVAQLLVCQYSEHQILIKRSDTDTSTHTHNFTNSFLCVVREENVFHWIRLSSRIFQLFSSFLTLRWNQNEQGTTTVPKQCNRWQSPSLQPNISTLYSLISVLNG
jgi:hypothetical protein